MDRNEIYSIIRSKDKKGAYTQTDISLAVDEVEQFILNYCDISTLPDALRFTVVNMSIDLLKYQAKVNADTDQASVDSSQISLIKEGDTTIEFKKAGSAKGDERVNAFFLNYTQQLNKFRRLW